MATANDLKCPFCGYLFNTDNTTFYEPCKVHVVICPCCSAKVVYQRSMEGLYITSNDCSSNDMPHRWKYSRSPDSDIKKNCTRCKKTVPRVKQKTLPLFI